MLNDEFGRVCRQKANTEYRNHGVAGRVPISVFVIRRSPPPLAMYSSLRE